MKGNFRMIGFLSPSENRESTGWLVIATFAPFKTTTDKQLRILSSSFPKKMPNKSYSFHRIDKFEQTTSLKIDKAKILGENLKEELGISEKHQILLVPVDQQSGEIMVENIVRLDSATFTSGRINGADQLSAGDFSVSEKQWESLVDSLTAFHGELQQIDGKSGISDWKSNPLDCKVVGRTKQLQGKSRISKGSQKAMKIGETGNELEAESQNRELARIEMKSDPNIEKFCSGDLLRFKVTMYKVRERLDENFDHQVEIDFVQHFQCKPVTQNACRCRRITKLLKRTVLTDLEWEKGMHISGQQFAVSWINFEIPNLDDEKEKRVEINNKERNDAFISEAKYERKFRVTDCQLELQIRLYEKMINPEIEGQSQNILATCCCFPLDMMPIGD